MKATLKRSLIRRVPAGVLPYLKSVQCSATVMGGGLLRSLPGTSLRFGPPRQITSSLAEYVAAQQRAGAGERANYVELRPSELLIRMLPPSPEGTPHPAFRSELRRLSPPAGVAMIAGARVLTRTGAVIAPGDCLVADVSSGFLADDPRGNEVFLSLKLPSRTRVEGAVAVLTMAASSNYFHWIFDALPRLRLIEESGYRWDRIAAPRLMHFQRQALALLGFENGRIIDAPDAHIEPTRLIVPTLPGISGNPPRWVCEFLRDAFLRHVDVPPIRRRKLYVSRRKSGTRKVINEDELYAALQAEGFDFFFLEELEFLEQVRLFSEARIVVSAHGSGLSNTVFCPPGCGVIELFSPHYVNVCFWAVANQVGLEYRYVLGKGRQRPGTSAGRVHENILVDVAAVRAAVRELS